jgi:hypothetical protein
MSCRRTVFRTPARLLFVAFCATLANSLLCAQQIPLSALVDPSTVIVKDGKPLTFAIHGFIEFRSLKEMFPYIESQEERWKNHPQFSSEQRQQLAQDLLRRGIESRVISMIDERPLEALLTHTPEELKQALAGIKGSTPPGYADDFLAVQDKWKHAVNCWSAAPWIPARVLSNWYPIEEGIELYGDRYDSTEHFWQAVKYHPATTIADLNDLIGVLEQKDWKEWLARLDGDPTIYLANAYAVEFVRYNLSREKLKWFRDELEKQGMSSSDHARKVQQRGMQPVRFTAFEEKVLWGDLADLFHLIYALSQEDDPIRQTLAAKHFDNIYLGDRRMGFVSEEFRSLMLDIWRVKYLKMKRFGDVIRSIPDEIQLEHFLNDGDSPDIPIPVYVGYLNKIREMARAQQ